MNKVILLGRVIKDIEMKNTKKLRIAEGSLAVSGTKEGETLFIDFTAFERTAELLASVKKGQRILLEGRLVLEKFEKKDGTKVSKHKLVVSTMTYIEKKGEAADTDGDLF